MSSTTGPGVYNIGNGGVVIEHDDPVTSPEVDHSELANAPLNEPQQQATENARGHKRLSDKKQQFFGRPKNGGTLL
jgi:hypothetical protein